MESITITLLPEGRTLSAPKGGNLLSVLRQGGVPVDSPCGGQGRCGKCTVELVEPEGVRALPACTVTVTQPLTLRLPRPAGDTVILSQGEDRPVPVAPLVRWIPVSLEDWDAPSMWDGLAGAIAGAAHLAPEDVLPAPRLLPRLEALRRDGVRTAWALLWKNQPLELTAQPPQSCLMAFDLGTTTLVGYLLDGLTGETLAVASAANPQAAYGADVISRAEYAVQGGGAELRRCVEDALATLVRQAAEEAGRSPEQILLAAVAGNTCMHHLWLGLSPASLIQAPYRPVLRAPLDLPAAACRLPIHPVGRVLALPNLAGFVGADTAACLLAAGFHRRERPALLVDIGTNGELVLGDRRRRLACSTAAGPAFEGANISQGMRGGPGAIDHVTLEGDTLRCHVIGGGKAAGLCGSGLVDAAARLLALGVIDATGRMAGAEELPPALAGRIVQRDGQPAFVLTPPSDSRDGQPVVLTQRDVRELQLAKAAIAAGIALLAQSWGIALGDIPEVLLAGAFGSFMDLDCAYAIGLLPPELEGRARPIGNAAGTGARLAALSAGQLRLCTRLAGETACLDLAAHPEFQTRYFTAMNFGPAEDWDL